MSKKERTVFASWISFLVLLLVIITTCSGCSGNWIIAGVDIAPTGSITTDFMIITDQDSVNHWYVRTIAEGGILVGDNWCHRHEKWETVQKK